MSAVPMVSMSRSLLKLATSVVYWNSSSTWLPRCSHSAREGLREALGQCAVARDDERPPPPLLGRERASWRASFSTCIPNTCSS